MQFFIVSTNELYEFIAFNKLFPYTANTPRIWLKKCDLTNGCARAVYANIYIAIIFWFMKTGALVDIMSGTSYIVVRSILSKTVPPAELGTWTVVRLGNRADDDGIPEFSGK